jgi:hypothetical protein
MPKCEVKSYARIDPTMRPELERRILVTLRPLRCSSCKPAILSLAKRFRHLLTVDGRVPSSLWQSRASSYPQRNAERS